MRRSQDEAGGPDVRAEYARRLDDRRRSHAAQERLERVITEARLVVFLAGGVVAWLAFRSGRLAPGWLAVPVGAFAVLLVLHERARRASVRAGRAVAFYERGLARLDGRWAGAGESGLRFLDPEHPYAADLDLFGAGSLFERLCTARTRAGEETLAGWLLRAAPPGEIVARQAAIDELRPRLDLREDLEVLGTDVRAGIEPEALAAWGASPRVFATGRPAVVAAAVVLAAFDVATLVGWAAFGTGLSPFLLALMLAIVFTLALSGKVHRVLAPVRRKTHDLALLAHLLERLEGERAEAPMLLRLASALAVEGRPASRRIAHLVQLLHLLDTEKNQLFAPIGGMLLWTVQLAIAIDGWRARHGPAIAGWLAAVGEFEALCALASYASENPGDPFAEVVPGAALFDGIDVGHPLLAESACVRNDVSLGVEARVLVISGSNMSGKSTLLRTVGVNAVLALAGAPVRARRLRVAPMAIGATLRVQDSLQAGRSRFFAEITRIRQLVDLTEGPLPLLFLLDEVLHGTNSHDRQIGAEAIVRGLLGRGAVGLVTTHDLALAEIVERLAPRARNVHFEDQFADGTLHFDYRMRPGVVRHSNALALMRAVGLEV